LISTPFYCTSNFRTFVFFDKSLLIGCYWMIFGGELGIFLSESGFPGFEDFQDVIG
jgi:hypothetical protein